MTNRARGFAVLAVQLAVVLSIAAKYAWERHHSPMVWTRTVQFDPNRVIRGRYLSLSLQASACGLPVGDGVRSFGRTRQNDWVNIPAEHWSRVQPVARNGLLTARVEPTIEPGETQELTQPHDMPCEAATLSEQTEFFISEHAQTPFPLPKGQELWALVTVPPTGPPRPVQLAISDGKNFRVLDLR